VFCIKNTLIKWMI